MKTLLALATGVVFVPALAGGAVDTLADAHRLSLREVRQLGPDLRIRYAVERAAERS